LLAVFSEAKSNENNKKEKTETKPEEKTETVSGPGRATSRMKMKI